MSAASIAIQIVPKFTSSLSIIGSSMIISQVLRSQHNRSLPHQRILLGMSCVDILNSTVWLFSELFVPTEPGEGFVLHGTSGNQRTCDAQGFIVQFGIASSMYNSMLSLYYYLVINRGWKEDAFKKIEPYIHALPLSWGLGTAIAAQVMNLYNPNNWDCWIAPYPADCLQSYQNGGESNCIRGDNASVYEFAFYFVPLWVCIIFITSTMIAIYRHVRQKELATAKYTKGPRCNECHATLKYTREVFYQSLFYVGAFYITWIFPTITRIYQLIAKKAHTPHILLVLGATFVPIQGFFNSCTYFRPRAKKLRRENPDKPWSHILYILLREAIFCCGSCCEKGFQGSKDIIEPPSHDHV